MTFDAVRLVGSTIAAEFGSDWAVASDASSSQVLESLFVD